MKYLFIILCLFLFSSCDESNLNSFNKKARESIDEKSLLKDLEESTIKSVKEEFKKRGLTYKVESLTLIHKSGNEYTGVLKTLFYGTEQSLPIEVVYDGSNLVWQIKQ